MVYEIGKAEHIFSRGPCMSFTIGYLGIFHLGVLNCVPEA